METSSLWDTYLPHYTEEFFLLIPKLSPSSFPQRGLHKPHTQHHQEEPKTKVTGADLLLALTSPPTLLLFTVWAPYHRGCFIRATPRWGLRNPEQSNAFFLPQWKWSFFLVLGC